MVASTGHIKLSVLAMGSERRPADLLGDLEVKRASWTEPERNVLYWWLLGRTLSRYGCACLARGIRTAVSIAGRGLRALW